VRYIPRMHFRTPAAILALGLAAAACVAPPGYAPPTPPTPGPYDDLPVDATIHADGLTAPVDVVRDRFGVPHIHARTIDDAAFANGYVMAADRLAQMELFRHSASGTLSRLFGALDESVLDQDLAMRVHRMRPIAEATWATLSASTDPTDKRIVRTFSRFADGVNQYAAELAQGLHTLDPSVAIFFHIEGWLPWTPVDTAWRSTDQKVGGSSPSGRAGKPLCWQGISPWTPHGPF